MVNRREDEAVCGAESAPPGWTMIRWEAEKVQASRRWIPSSKKNKVAECEPVHQAHLRQLYFVSVIVPVAS